jgi:hypothetical protein
LGRNERRSVVIYKYWKSISPYENKQWLIVHFWKIFLTFNFITFTRIWVPLRRRWRTHDYVESNLEQLYFSMDTLGLVLWTFRSVFWVMLIGYIFHWLPQRIKNTYEGWFTKVTHATPSACRCSNHFHNVPSRFGHLQTVCLFPVLKKKLRITNY